MPRSCFAPPPAQWPAGLRLCGLRALVYSDTFLWTIRHMGGGACSRDEDFVRGKVARGLGLRDTSDVSAIAVKENCGDAQTPPNMHRLSLCSPEIANLSCTCTAPPRAVPWRAGSALSCVQSA